VFVGGGKDMVVLGGYSDKVVGSGTIDYGRKQNNFVG
jgi:hypothetical protein